MGDAWAAFEAGGVPGEVFADETTGVGTVSPEPLGGEAIDIVVVDHCQHAEQGKGLG